MVRHFRQQEVLLYVLMDKFQVYRIESCGTFNNISNGIKKALLVTLTNDELSIDLYK